MEFEDYLRQHFSSLVASCVFFPVAMYKMLRYILRKIVSIFLRMVSFSSDFVTNIRSFFICILLRG